MCVAEELGDHELKGVPAPVTLYRIGRTSGGGRRAGQRHLTLLVGREEEIAMPHRPAIAAHPACSVLTNFFGKSPTGPGRAPLCMSPFGHGSGNLSHP